jgi:hypothetical protein
MFDSGSSTAAAQLSLTAVVTAVTLLLLIVQRLRNGMYWR